MPAIVLHRERAAEPGEYPYCGTCAHYGSSTCGGCEEGDSYELDPQIIEIIEEEFA